MTLLDFLPELTHKKVCADCGAETVGPDHWLHNFKSGKKDFLCRICYVKRLYGKEEKTNG